MNLKQVIKNPLSSSTWKQFALGQKGVLGTATATAVLEFGTQLIDRYAPSQVNRIMSKQVMGNAPFLGSISVRDTIVLAPAITSALGAVKGGSKKGNIMNALAGYGTKVMLRRTGLNPKLLSKGSPSPTNPRVRVGSGMTQNSGVYP